MALPPGLRLGDPGVGAAVAAALAPAGRARPNPEEMYRVAGELAVAAVADRLDADLEGGLAELAWARRLLGPGHALRGALADAVRRVYGVRPPD